MNQDHTKKLIQFYQSSKRMPSYSEMMQIYGYKSKNAVYRLIQKMLDAGIVAKDALGHLIPSASFNELPFVGSVKAGLPSEVDEQRDTVNVEDYLVRKKDSTYMFEVDGDSMIDAHIADGDMVIAEYTKSARDGQIVIARVDNEYTMKYFRTDGKKSWLEAANKNYKDIHPKESLEIVAVVKGVMRKY